MYNWLPIKGGEMAESPKYRVIQFGTFELDTSSGELRKAGLRIRLQPQPFKVLEMLTARPGEVVTREEIQEQVWGAGTFVDFEQGLNFCIKQIRAVLNDDADTPRYIETIPKRGYRFLMDTVRTGTPPAKRAGDPREPGAGTLALAAKLLAGAALLSLAIYAGWSLRQEPRTEKIMLAVLPFENLTSNPDQEYFSDGMTEELILRMGRLNPGRLGVIARTSAMQYKASKKPIAVIGRELNVSHVLEGSVRRENNRVRITAQLIQVGDQTHLWADAFDMDMHSIFEAWDEVATQVAGALTVELLTDASAPRAGPVPPIEVRDSYLRGRYFLNKRSVENLQKAKGHFQRVLELDSEYAPALAGLADVYALLGSAAFGALAPAEAMPQAREAALQSLSLDPTLAVAHTALAYETLMYEWDWEAAERSFQAALALDPNSAETRHWYAYLLAALNRSDEAIAQARLALELDPVSLSVNSGLAWHLYFVGRYQEAIEQLERTMELEPTFAIARFDKGMLLMQLGRTEDAVLEFQTAVRLSSRAPLCLAGLGTAYAVAAREQDARAILRELTALLEQRYVPAIYLAGIHAALGEKDTAFEWLEKAYQQRSNYLIFLDVEPAFRTLRSDPRLEEMLARLNLPRRSARPVAD